MDIVGEHSSTPCREQEVLCKRDVSLHLILINLNNPKWVAAIMWDSTVPELEQVMEYLSPKGLEADQMPSLSMTDDKSGAWRCHCLVPRPSGSCVAPGARTKAGGRTLRLVLHVHVLCSRQL